MNSPALITDRLIKANRDQNNLSCNLTKNQDTPFHIAVIAEDLRLPIDEGAKKTSFSLIYSFIEKGVKLSIFSRHSPPFFEKTHQLPGNKLLFGTSFARNLKTLAPDAILYIPASSGTLGAFVRAAAIKAQSSGIPLALLNLQYRELPVCAHYINLPRYTDIVFTQSQASTNIFRSFNCKTMMLPGSVDQTIFQPVTSKEKHLLRLEYGFQDSDQIVIHVGHCKKERNVSALSKLVQSGFKAILIVSTSTITDAYLLAQLQHTGVEVISHFLKNIQHYYQMADCYLFPVFKAVSAIDTPLSVLEAMACNLPVVTTKFGGLPSMFQAGEGFYYADTENEMIRMVKIAVEKKGLKTAQLVSPYSWNHTASMILEALQKTTN